MDPRPLSLFYSYAHEDESLRKKLEKHLAMLRRDGIIAEWHDRKILAGDEWDGEINEHLETADLVLFLVSADFLASDYCFGVEVNRAMARHQAGDARVIPVFLRACDWTGAPFGKIQGTPKDARPVTSWENPDEAFTDVARAIRRAAEAMRDRPPPPPPTAPALWTIPAPTRTFTGRERLLGDIQKTLAAGDRVALTALNGLGGIGKTQAAYAFAHRHRDRYDVGWLVRAQEPGVLATDLSGLAVRLGLAEPTAGPDATLAALRQWWATHDRWLLLYDNAEAAAAVRDVLPTEGRGHVLITSRAAGWTSTATSVPVLRLDRAESVGLLLRRAGRDPDDAARRDAADRLAEDLGDLPLALEHAAAYVEASGISLGAYHDLFRQRRIEMLAIVPDDAAYTESVAATWALAFEAAEADEPAAGALLRVFACLAPNDLPAEHIRAWDEWPAPLDTLASDALLWPESLKALRKHSLIRIDDDGTLSVHRLVQAVTFDRMDEAERHSWATAAQQVMLGILDVGLQAMSGRIDEFAPLIPHALATAALAGDEDTRSGILDRAATFSQLRADYAEAEELFLRALSIAEAAYGLDHTSVAVRLNNLGALLNDRGDLGGAETALRRAIAIIEATYGPGHPEVAVNLNNLGSVLCGRGDLNGAEAAYLRALAISGAAYGPDHPNVAICESNFGGVLEARGDFDGAEDAYCRALSIIEAVYGPDHPTVAICESNLGGVLRAQGDLDGAEAAFRRALAIDDATYGPNHPNVATGVNSLGGVLRARGDLDGAEAAFRRALAIFEAKLGSDHPNAEIVRQHLARLRS